MGSDKDIMNEKQNLLLVVRVEPVNANFQRVRPIDASKEAKLLAKGWTTKKSLKKDESGNLAYVTWYTTPDGTREFDSLKYAVNHDKYPKGKESANDEYWPVAGPAEQHTRRLAQVSPYRAQGDEIGFLYAGTIVGGLSVTLLLGRYLFRRFLEPTKPEDQFHEL